MNNPDLQSMSKEELIDLAKATIKFTEQQKKGKRPEAFSRFLIDIVKDMPSPTFANVLYELELAAIRREKEGEKASIVERLDRIWQLVTWHHPKRGRLQMPFSTLRNKLSRAKKIKSLREIAGSEK